MIRYPTRHRETKSREDRLREAGQQVVAPLEEAHAQGPALGAPRMRR